MLQLRRLGCAALVAASALLAAGTLRAQEVAAPVIIIVDVQQILRDSLVAKNIQGQMNDRTDRYTKEVSAQENELRRTQDELERQRTVLSPDAFNTKMRDFQQRYDALDHGVQVTRQALQQAYNDAMTKVENTALQIISDIASERKANLVITKAAVLFEAPGLDITQDVIHRLDEKLPSVPLAVAQEPGLATPGGAPAAAPPAKN
jgi:Skp family chaperone for outer membrane proteins